MARPDEEKGEPSSPCSPTSPNEKRALQQKDSPPEWRERQLYLREFAMLRCIQRSTPRFVLPLALFVHRLASQVLLIPLVGIFTWAVDMPAAASTSTCACFCVSLNYGLKWIWQRPRPLWLDNGKVSEVWNIGAVFEGDYSFPSGHAHSLSGVILCAFFTFKLELHWLPLFLLLTALIALTRNYLRVHWCSDTLTGWAIGSLSGVLWGLLDPYELLLRRQDPWLSMAWGFTFAVSLVGLAALGLMLTTPVQASVRAEWLATAVQGLDTRVAPADEAPEAPRCLPQKPRELRARHLAYAAGPAVCGGMLLGLTGLYRDLPRHLLYCLEMRPPPHVAALRVLVGLLGSGLIMSFLALPLYFVRDVSLEEGTTPRATGKAMLLMLPLTLAPWWVFLLSQLLLEELGLGCRPPGLPGPPGPPGPP